MNLSPAKKRLSFTFLNITQFLGALNDNFFKLLIAYLLIDAKGIENSSEILATAGAIFVIPFLLFSFPAGVLADRFSKRSITVFVKVLEIFVMAGGILAFSLKSPLGCYTTLFLMATQSAIFGPSKYGIIPELVSSDRISKANGIISSFTFLAIIIGTFLASFVIEISHRNFVLASLLAFVFALIGAVTSICIEKTPAVRSPKKINPLFIVDIWKALVKAKKESYLLLAMTGTAYFLFIGAFTQLNIIPYAAEIMGLSDVQGGYLFLMTALGIGTGSLIAGKLSGHYVELGLVPLGGVGMTICLLVLFFCSGSLVLVVATVIILGVFGGLFLVPLDSFIQALSPNEDRGQNISIGAFLGFVGVLCASGVISLLCHVLNLSPAYGFLVVGILTGLATLTIFFIAPEAIARLFCKLLVKRSLQLSLSDHLHLPSLKPAVIFCHGAPWRESINLLLATQHRYIRFFVENPAEGSLEKGLFMRLLKVVTFSVEKGGPPKNIVPQKVRDLLDRGFIVCIVPAEVNRYKTVEEMVERYSQGLREVDHPLIIPISIHNTQM